MKYTINDSKLSTFGLLNSKEAKLCKIGDTLIANGEKYLRIDARKNGGDAWKLLKQ